MQRVTTDDCPRIGELAERAGLTVRTLHHYDQIGLVRASERTEAGRRRYSGADVRRLCQVVALRSLGVPLARIARAVEGDGFTLKDAVTAQLEAVDGELLHARRLRRRLERIAWDAHSRWAGARHVCNVRRAALRSGRTTWYGGRGSLELAR